MMQSTAHETKCMWCAWNSLLADKAYSQDRKHKVKCNWGWLIFKQFYRGPTWEGSLTNTSSVYENEYIVLSIFSDLSMPSFLGKVNLLSFF